MRVHNKTVILLSTALLMGCRQDTTPETVQEEYVSAPAYRTGWEGGSRARGWSTHIWTDPDTGCQYVVWQAYARGAVTIRYDRDGRPMCPGAQEDNSDAG